MDDQQFQSHAEPAMEALKQSLMDAEESADIEVEDQSGALHISFAELRRTCATERLVIAAGELAVAAWVVKTLSLLTAILPAPSALLTR